MDRQRKGKVEKGMVGGAGKEWSPESVIPLRELFLGMGMGSTGCLCSASPKKEDCPRGVLALGFVSDLCSVVT